MTSASKDTPAVLVDRCISSSFDQITHHNIWNAGRHLINSLLKGDCPKEDPEECRKRARVCSFSSEPAPKKFCQDQTLLNTTLTRSSELQHFQSLGLGAKRIDYVLQPEKFLGFLTKNSYLSGLTAHFSYWTHKDLLWHIVRRLEN
ncbi:hypothetical protein G6F56_011714 [Rhizopus delemar]|nr:hypothetical protein G6F56_011714 [Rhizopus delemar]